MKYLVSLHQNKSPASIGNKSASLHLLWKKGNIIPKTYVCIWDAYLTYLHNEENILTGLRRELSQILAPDRSYAVRSSANIEDTLERSFAGQFSSFLDVSGVDQVLDAIQQIWQDSQSQSVNTYITRTVGNHLELKMAVIIQKVVGAHHGTRFYPSFAGVARSHNFYPSPPLTAEDGVVTVALGLRGRLEASTAPPSRGDSWW